MRVRIDAEGTRGRRKRLGRRQHVRQVARMVADRFDVKERGTRDMGRQKLGGGIALCGRQVVRAVEHAHAGVVEMGSKPVA